MLAGTLRSPTKSCHTLTGEPGWLTCPATCWSRLLPRKCYWYRSQSNPSSTNRYWYTSHRNYQNLNALIDKQQTSYLGVGRHVEGSWGHPVVWLGRSWPAQGNWEQKHVLHATFQDSHHIASKRQTKTITIGFVQFMSPICVQNWWLDVIFLSL